MRTRTAVTVTPDAVAERRGVPAGVIRRLARELAVADRGVVHAPIGATTQEFGSMTSWLVDVLNTGTGTSIARAVPCSRSRPPVVRTPTRPGPEGGHDRWTSRVRGAWGHVGSGLALGVAAENPGSNVNLLTDDEHREPLTGSPSFTAAPVTIAASP